MVFSAARRLAAWVVVLASLALAPLVAGGADDGQLRDAQRRHGLDPTVPLARRVGETPASVLALFDEPGQPAPTPHALTEVERGRLADAFETLPPLLRRTLAQRLRTVSFLDGMPNTALSSKMMRKYKFEFAIALLKCFL